LAAKTDNGSKEKGFPVWWKIGVGPGICPDKDKATVVIRQRLPVR
jgi:hypothetical protein